MTNEEIARLGYRLDNQPKTTKKQPLDGVYHDLSEPFADSLTRLCAAVENVLDEYDSREKLNYAYNKMVNQLCKTKKRLDNENEKLRPSIITKSN